jgi:hypothetical protein
LPPAVKPKKQLLGDLRPPPFYSAPLRPAPFGDFASLRKAGLRSSTQNETRRAALRSGKLTLALRLRSGRSSSFRKVHPREFAIVFQSGGIIGAGGVDFIVEPAQMYSFPFISNAGTPLFLFFAITDADKA